MGQNATPLIVSEPVEARPAVLEAEKIIREHVIFAVAAGLVPSPVVDIVAVTWIEVDMITKLAKAYSFPVPHRLVTYKVLISLIGGIGPAWLGLKLQGLIKGVPLVGHALYAGFTLGGLRTTVDAQVRRPDGSVIPGLYAAGACASTIAQDGKGYVSGAQLGEGSFFGRRAGRHAARLRALG